MKLKRLQLKQFRNYDSLDLTFDKNLTIFAGENAQGKTNILEAIFLLSLTKSHRTNQDNDMIQEDQSRAVIKGEVALNHYDLPLELILTRKGKVAKVNHLEQQKLSHFVGKLNVILFAPEDLQLIKGSPSLRRKFMDSELGQSYPVYLNELSQYQKILRQRNHYLKQHGRNSTFDPIYFEILTDQLVDKAIIIIQYRLDFIQTLQQIVEPIHYQLSNQRDHLFLEYKSSTSQVDYTNNESIRDQLLNELERVHEREKLQGNTLVGPHRDELEISINNKKAQLFASQGQQRTAILSIKLAEIDWMYQITNEYPLLLLDDVLSELDDERQRILMEYIEQKTQTFLTTAAVKDMTNNHLKDAQVYIVKEGTVSKGM